MSKRGLQNPDPSDLAPSPLTVDDLARIEEALRQLAVAENLIQRCERCKIPVTEARADCDALKSFLAAVHAEFRGPQSPIGG